MNQESGIISYAHPLESLSREMAKVVVGRKSETKLLLTAMLSSGHVLLEDLPGMGKTTLVKAFAKALHCTYRRIQCTPDLLPSDVIGLSIYNPKTSEFTFKQGPVFTEILLVDEINRALPRTQSSLLESMEERQVSIDGKPFALPEPFMVLATQNPIEMEGTFPLPEAQLDRFLMRIGLGYPTAEEEEEILGKVGDSVPYEDVEEILDPNRITQLQEECGKVFVHSAIRQYIVRLAGATRNHPLIAMGVSPRASKALYKAVKAWAYLDGRSFVFPDDVKELLLPIWNHRLVLNTEARISQINCTQILNEILDKIPLPEEYLGRDGHE